VLGKFKIDLLQGVISHTFFFLLEPYRGDIFMPSKKLSHHLQQLPAYALNSSSLDAAPSREAGKTKEIIHRSSKQVQFDAC
jgi:hypothetical protein